MNESFCHNYNIGESVFYINANSPIGIILDIRYSLKEKKLEYLVTFGWVLSDRVWCSEAELVRNRNF
jgi:hypothetical protein